MHHTPHIPLQKTPHLTSHDARLTSYLSLVSDLSRACSLPRASAPDADVSKVRGNVSEELKQLMSNALEHYAAGGTIVFGSEQAKKLVFVEVNL